MTGRPKRIGYRSETKKEGTTPASTPFSMAAAGNGKSGWFGEQGRTAPAMKSTELRIAHLVGHEQHANQPVHR
jgi:hypothetical protein